MTRPRLAQEHLCTATVMSLAARAVEMCDRCDQIDKKIEKFKIVAARFTDQQMTEGLAVAIAELEARKAALHARSRLRSSSDVNTVPKP